MALVLTITRCQFQFTPLREGRPDGISQQWVRQISIHAPPRGATTPAAQAATHKPISIHAPPRGATPPPADPAVRVRFQFTPLREGRLHGRNGQHHRHYFNSRPSARGDGRVVFLSFVAFHFNSRPSARGDVIADGEGRMPTNFNSRPSARGDTQGA